MVRGQIAPVFYPKILEVIPRNATILAIIVTRILSCDKGKIEILVSDYITMDDIKNNPELPWN